jgi:ribonuclease BN (tRNA processing enzyme)
VRIELLGCSGGAPSETRETACIFVREGERALLLDAGTGVRRLVTDRRRLAGLTRLEVVLTHFHLDHVCGLTDLPRDQLDITVWAPGAWLYDKPTIEILAPLLRPPIAPTDATQTIAVAELREEQVIGGFRVRAGAQLRHWAPTAGLRVDDAVALITDTAYEPASSELARGVAHLLHEAWSSSAVPIHPECDATAADAARVAVEAGVPSLTLIHLNPSLPDHSILLDDARPLFARVVLGRDEMILEAIS